MEDTEEEIQKIKEHLSELGSAKVSAEKKEQKTE